MRRSPMLLVLALLISACGGTSSHALAADAASDTARCAAAGPGQTDIGDRSMPEIVQQALHPGGRLDHDAALGIGQRRRDQRREHGAGNDDVHVLGGERPDR